jgi:hypothetical protein
VVEAEEAEDGGVQVVGGDGVFGDVEAHLVEPQSASASSPSTAERPTIC